MALMAENSAIKVDANLEKKIRNASPEEVKELMHEAMVDQGLATRDYYDNSVLLPTALATAPQKFARPVVIDGKKHIVEADTELALEKAVGDLYRSQLQPAVTTQQAQQPRDPSTGHFVEQGKQDERRAALDLQFQLGQISVADYIEKSGAVDTYLAKAGVPIEDLKAAVAEKQSQRFEQSWAQATEEFKRSTAGADWPGGQKNVEIIGNIIFENNLMDADDKSKALATAYEIARERGLLVANEELDQARRIAEAKSPSELMAALQPPERQIARMQSEQAASGMFGR